MRHRASGLSRAVAGRCGATLLALSVAAPLAAQSPGDGLRILGFRRQLVPDTVELILACSGPVSFRYSTPELETIRLLLPGIDPEGVTPPREAWGEDVADVELSPAMGAEAPGAILLLKLDEFRPYSISAAGNELKIALDAPGVAPPPPPAPAAEPAPAEPIAAPSDAAPVPLPEPPPDRGMPDVPVETVAATPAPVETPSAPGPATDDEREPVVEPDFFEGPAPEPPPAAEPEPEPEPAPLDPPTTSPAPPADGPAATRVFEVVRDDRDGVLAIRIPTDGHPSYQAFFTQEGPLRLVLDFDGTESRPLFQTLDVGIGPVRRVRVGQHQAAPVPVVRIVIDLDERVSHRIENDAAGLTVRFDGVPVEP